RPMAKASGMRLESDGYRGLAPLPGCRPARIFNAPSLSLSWLRLATSGSARFRGRQPYLIVRKILYVIKSTFGASGENPAGLERPAQCYTRIRRRVDGTGSATGTRTLRVPGAPARLCGGAVRHGAMPTAVTGAL